MDMMIKVSYKIQCYVIVSAQVSVKLSVFSRPLEPTAVCSVTNSKSVLNVGASVPN